jgi:hypothetical protein
MFLRNIWYLLTRPQQGVIIQKAKCINKTVRACNVHSTGAFTRWNCTGHVKIRVHLSYRRTCSRPTNCLSAQSTFSSLVVYLTIFLQATGLRNDKLNYNGCEENSRGYFVLHPDIRMNKMRNTPRI